MKKKCILLVLAGFITVYAGSGLSNDSTAEKGKDLFNDSGLGGSANMTSCATCHPDGKGLERAGDRDDLTEMINTCIQRPLAGQPLDKDSAEMESLTMYIKTLKK